MLKNEKGFTLIEIIAVLVILGILAAVAIPRYVSMMDQSRISAAQGAIGEIKGRCSSAYAKLLLSNNGSDPGGATVLAAISSDAGSDFSGITVTGTSNLVITVPTVKNNTMSFTPSSTWYYPSVS
jgi:prepilin-type N-terminal cleavage/methylation domain-containing protein